MSPCQGKFRVLVFRYGVTGQISTLAKENSGVLESTISLINKWRFFMSVDCYVKMVYGL